MSMNPSEMARVEQETFDAVRKTLEELEDMSSPLLDPEPAEPQTDCTCHLGVCLC